MEFQLYEYASTLLISIGAIFLLFCIFKGMTIWKITPEKLRKKWFIALSLICLFFIGYLLVIDIIFFHVKFPLIIITGLVFFGGALFVYIIISLSQKTIQAMDETTKIKAFIKQKDDLILQLGHDLKTPLGPLLNLIPVIEKKNTDPDLKELFTVINRNVHHMKNLVTKTIQLSQLNAPDTKLSLEKVNFSKKIRDIIKKNAFFFNEHHIDVDITIPDDMEIYIDPLKFHEFIDNILNNAVKYSKKNKGKISINLVDSDDCYLFSIKDDGIGMTSDQLEHVFDEFYKADGSRHDFESNGLGMPICKRIIEMHGGRIWVESNGIGKGSAFYFTLPKKIP